ncbi:MAG: MFS transporter [Gammaproteobacteria bacterium]|nr:MFS transporter [Gammaproteobacteria bacterium]
MNQSIRTQLWAWLIVLTASMFFFYEFIQMNMFNSLAVSFEQTFHLSAMQVAMVSAFYFLSDSILLYPTGFILDRFSSRKMILLGMVMCIAGTVLITEATNSWFLVGARFLAGTASAFCLLSILRLASQWFPSHKMGQVTGIVVTIGMLGGTFSQVPLTMLIEAHGWRDALRDVAWFGVALLFLMVLLVKDAPLGKRFAALQSDQGQHKIAFWHSLALMVKNKNNWLAGMFICTMNLPIMILAGLFGSQFMEQGYGFDAIRSSTISMMIFIGTIIGSSVFGFLSDYMRNRRIPMIATAILSFIIFAIIMYGPHFCYMAYILLFLGLGFFTGSQIIGYPVTQESNRAVLVGSALGFVSVLIMGLPALLQPLTGWLMQIDWNGQMQNGAAVYSLADYQHGLLVLLVGFIISIVCAWALPETYGHKIE